MSSADYKEPCAGIITDCISLPLSLLSITLLRDGPSTVQIYSWKWKVFTKKRKEKKIDRLGYTHFDGCWGSVVVVAVAVVYTAAWWQGRAGLMKWHFSFCVLLLTVCQPVITADSANWLGRGTLRSREKSWQRWRMGGRGERYRKKRNRSLFSRSVWWLLIIFSSRRRVAENSLIS